MCVQKVINILYLEIFLKTKLRYYHCDASRFASTATLNRSCNGLSKIRSACGRSNNVFIIEACSATQVDSFRKHFKYFIEFSIIKYISKNKDLKQ